MSVLDKFRPFDTWVPRDRMLKGKDYICKAKNFTVKPFTLLENP